MTINVNFATVADGISNISIAGITVKDIDAIPDSVTMLCPILIPQPNDFISDIQVTRMSYGGAGSELLNMTYSLNYVFLQAQAGSGISAFSTYAGLISNLAAIIKAVLQNDNINGAVDMEMKSAPSIGVITDPAGNEYWGCLISFSVTEHLQ